VKQFLAPSSSAFGSRKMFKVRKSVRR